MSAETSPIRRVGRLGTLVAAGAVGIAAITGCSATVAQGPDKINPTPAPEQYINYRVIFERTVRIGNGQKQAVVECDVYSTQVNDRYGSINENSFGNELIISDTNCQDITPGAREALHIPTENPVDQLRITVNNFTIVHNR